jgi:hypothetical protein
MHRPTQRQTVLVAILAGVFIFIAGTVGPWLYYVGQGKRTVEEKLSQLRMAGYPLSLHEVNQHYHDGTLDPQQNAAHLYLEAFSHLEQGREPGESVARLREAFLELEPGEDLPDDLAAELADRLENNSATLEHLQAAAQLPYVRFDLDFTEGYSLLIPHVGQMRQGARLFALQAMQEASRGNVDAAADSLETALNMAWHLRDEPTLLSQLTRIAIIGIVCETLEWVLARAPLSRATLESLDANLSRHGEKPGLPIGLRAEMAAGNEIFTTPLQFFEEDDLEQSRWRVVLHVLSGRIHFDHAFYLEAMEDQLRVLDKPLEDWYHYRNDHLLSDVEEKGHLFSSYLMLSSGAILRAEVNSIARMRISRILLALDVHREETGRVREDLDPLAPRFGGSIPHDPVTGRPFRVSREENWLILESAGRMRQGTDREERPIQGRLPLSRERE